MDSLIIHKILGTIKGFASMLVVLNNIKNPGTDFETVQKLQYQIIFTSPWRDCERAYCTRRAFNEMCP